MAYSIILMNLRKWIIDTDGLNLSEDFIDSLIKEEKKQKEENKEE